MVKLYDSINEIGIDQSGKIDKTENDTAVVFCPRDSLEPNYSLFIPKRVTAQVHSYTKPRFKKRNRKSWFRPKIFTVCLFYLLRDYLNEFDYVVIENEYPGHTKEIINAACSMIEREKDCEIDRDMFRIQPRYKNTYPHKLANQVRKGERDAKIELEWYHFKRKM